MSSKSNNNSSNLEHPQQLKLGTWNVNRNFGNKISIEALLDRQKLDFIALQEVGDSLCEDSEHAGGAIDNMKSALNNLGYDYVSVARSTGARSHGGVALLYRRDLSKRGFIIEQENTSWNEASSWDSCDVVSLRIRREGMFDNDDTSMIISSFYLHASLNHNHNGDPDNKSVVAHCDKLREVLSAMPSNTLLMGDLNSQLVGIGQFSCVLHAERGNVLRDFIEEGSHRYVLPAGPTTFKKIVADNGKKELIDPSIGFNNDHIIVGSALRNFVASSDLYALPVTHVDSRAVDPDGIPRVGSLGSDHLPLIWNCKIHNLAVPESELVEITNFAKVTEHDRVIYNNVFRKEIRRCLAKRRRKMIVVERSLREADRAALPHSIPGRGAKTFWTDLAAGKYEAALDENGNWDHNKVVESFAESRKQIIAEAARANMNPGDLWDIVRKYWNLDNSSSLAPPLKLPDNKTTSSHEERIEALADAYADVSKSSADPGLKEFQEEMKKDPNVAKSHETVCFAEMKAAIAEMKTGKCADFLGIRSEHLKLLDDESLKLIVPFFNYLVKTGTCPHHWRVAYVSPVPKPKRDRSLVKSWRPVSVVSSLSRLTERIVSARISHAWEKHRKGRAQFGFRRGVWTSFPLTALSLFARDGLKQHINYPIWDENDFDQHGNQRNSKGKGAKQEVRAQHKHVTLLVSIDASDAFCRAPPLSVVKKIRDMGLPAEANWVASLLSERSLRVREKGAESSSRSLDIGFPQGTILGPLLWSILVDSLIEDLEKLCAKPTPGQVSSVIQFADDCNVAIRGFHPQAMIKQANRLMRCVKDWSVRHNIPMAKMQAIWITKSFIINSAIKKSVAAAMRADFEKDVQAATASNKPPPPLPKELADLEMDIEKNKNRDRYSSSDDDYDDDESDAEDVHHVGKRGVAIDFAQSCGEKIVFDENVWCYATVGKMRLLGLWYDSNFRFSEHVKLLISKCNSLLFWLEGMKRYVPAEKIKMLYEGLVLSRITFAVDAYYPFITEKSRSALDRIHYHGCRIITGVMKKTQSESVICEAGYKPLRFHLEEVIAKTANALAHYCDYRPLIPKLRCQLQVSFGMQWLIKLCRNLQQPTASLRPKISADGTRVTSVPNSVFPPPDSKQPNFLRVSDDYQYKSDGKFFDPSSASLAPDALSVRDVFVKWISLSDSTPRMVRTRVHPYPPHELAAFHDKIRFFASAPGGLKKPEGDKRDWPPGVEKQLHLANGARMQEVLAASDRSANWIFADAARCEKAGGSCAGAFMLFQSLRHQSENPVVTRFCIGGRHACVYSGESVTFLDSLIYCIKHSSSLLQKSKYLNFILDAQSIMSSIAKTWIRKMNHLEQEISRKLYQLAELGFHINIAFVFSHLGVAGNERVDEAANEARRKLGKFVPERGYQHYDSFRIIRKRLDLKFINYTMQQHGASFRFRSMQQLGLFHDDLVELGFPFQAMQNIISSHLPRSSAISRKDETRLYYARLGMFPELGGYYVQETLEDCPLCKKKQVLGRNGATIHHLLVSCETLNCCRKDDKGKEINLIQFLWENPLFSFTVLEYIFSLCSYNLFLSNTNNENNNTINNLSKKSLLSIPIFVPFSSDKYAQSKNQKQYPLAASDLLDAQRPLLSTDDEFLVNLI